MGKINQLSRQTAELIAAGEVVERPASVVKELAENSIDAGATRISVEIQNGGMTLIRVSDNGEGMDEADAKLAFVRHATSKIATSNDLDAIATMGFRGEALAAISSVSRVILLTRLRGALEGTHVAVEGGNLSACAPAGCPDGTTIAIKDLFFNTPARLKYLKKNTAEAAACEAVVERLALARPDISFRLIKDGTESIHTTGDGKLLNAIYSVLGRDFHNGLVHVDYMQDGIRVEGYVTKPSAARANRRMQFCYVNGRSVRAFAISGACEEACKGLMVSGRFPAFVLNVSLDCSQVDVNVHPAKTEIKFSGERRVFDTVYFAIKQALDEGTQRFPELEAGREAPEEQMRPASAPAMHFGGYERSMGAIHPARANELMEKAAEDNPFINLPSEFPHSFSLAASKPFLFDKLLDQAEQMRQQSFTKEEKIEEHKPEIRLVGELFQVYILAEYDGKFIVVDKHAAHEKRIYNALLSQKENLSSQLLLTPLVVRLQREQTRVVLDQLDVFSELGFEIEDFGEGSLVVRSMPSVARESDVQAILEEASEALAASKKGGFTFLDRLLFSVACKAAVRAGDKNSPAELVAVLEAVLTSDELRNCPHGRPVMAVFSRGELEKWFSR